MSRDTLSDLVGAIAITATAIFLFSMPSIVPTVMVV